MANEWSEVPEGLNAAARELVGELRAGKEAAGLSLARLGALTHYSRSSWERWLNGKRLVTEEALAGFARATGADGARLARLLAEAEAGGCGDAEGDGGPSGGAGPESAGRAASAAPSRARAPVLAQLPASVADFTGRRAQVEAMLGALLSEGPPERERAGETPVVVVSGGGGVGKTTLAVHVAHRAAARYPDGALHADLRGTDPDPRDPADVLAGWLRELGEDPQALPGELEERAARFRSLLRDRTLLVLLDNAQDAAQIRPLIPAAGRSAVIVTSRARLGHLPASCRLELEPMMYHEALSLLEKVAGAERLAREPQATGVVLDACAGLPLALRICAARLETRPAWSVRTLADRIAGEHRRLDELSVGDLALRTSFDMSYAQLAEDAAAAAEPDRLLSPARAFRLLGLAAVPDLGLPAAAALLGSDLEQAERALETLVNVYLLESPAPGRYRFHDLLRIYAGEKAQLEPRPAGAEALRRLGDWYVYAAFQAVSALDVTRPPEQALGALPPGLPEIGFEDAAAALAWLDAERGNLGALARLADLHGLHRIVIGLAAVTTPYHHLRGRWTELGELSEIALRNARASGDRTGQARALGALGWARFHAHEPGAALEVLGRALSVYEELGSATGQSSTLDRMSTVANAAGDRAAALAYQERSVERLREVGDERVLVAATVNLALTYALLGRAEAFFALCEKLLPQARRGGYGFAVAPLLEASGEMHLEAGRVPEALAALAESVEVFAGIGNRPGLADAEEHLGEAQLAAGDREQALGSWQRALAIFEVCDAPRAESVRARIREAEVGGGARRNGC
jgi:tetratricopeptide (TPR) repeat protein